MDDRGSFIPSPDALRTCIFSWSLADWHEYLVGSGRNLLAARFEFHRKRNRINTKWGPGAKGGHQKQTPPPVQNKKDQHHHHKKISLHHGTHQIKPGTFFPFVKSRIEIFGVGPLFTANE